jgi:hypothetical protein
MKKITIIKIMTVVVSNIAAADKAAPETPKPIQQADRWLIRSNAAPAAGEPTKLMSDRVDSSIPVKAVTPTDIPPISTEAPKRSLSMKPRVDIIRPVPTKETMKPREISEKPIDSILSIFGSTGMPALLSLRILGFFPGIRR